METAQQNVMPGLLSLPPKIRRRIYDYSGLVRNSHLILCGDSKRSDWYPAKNLQTSYSLLLTCKLIYIEVTAALYSENQFFFQPRTIDSMTSLLQLRPSTLKHLNKLLVGLNVTSCPDYPGYYTSRGCWGRQLWRPREIEPYDDPITTLTGQKRAFFVQWSTALIHVLTHVSPGRLRLYLTCDVENYEAASLSIKPLKEVDHLADCSIRLGRQRDPHLQTLARNTVLHATGQPPDPKEPFRYSDLPVEIRRRILKNTDLVTPLREVEWNSIERFSLRYCWLHENFYDTRNALEWTKSFKCVIRHRAGCFCRRYHSSFSLVCKCWQTPTPLFMVCRSIRDEAEAVFYSKNRVIITPVDGCNKEPKKNPDRFEASKFFDSIRPSALQHIRCLEIVFPPFEPGYCLRHSALYSDWKTTVHRFKDALCLPNLTLRVHMASNTADGHDVTSFRANITKDQGLDIWQTYQRILLPFRSWIDDGLKHFYFYLAYPWAFTAKTRRHEQIDYEFVAKRSSIIEGYMRDMILGKENAERLDRGREEAEKSNWLLDMLYDGSWAGYENPVLWYPT